MDGCLLSALMARGPVDMLAVIRLNGNMGSRGPQGHVGPKGFYGDVGVAGLSGEPGQRGPDGRSIGHGNHMTSDSADAQK